MEQATDHECGYKHLYFAALESLRAANKKIKEQAEQIKDLVLLMPETAKAQLEIRSHRFSSKDASKANVQRSLPPLMKDKEKGTERLRFKAEKRRDMHIALPDAPASLAQFVLQPASKKKEVQPTRLSRSTLSSVFTPSTTHSGISLSAVESDEVVARKLQEEDNVMLGLDDETYAKILQDIEDKKTAQRNSTANMDKLVDSTLLATTLQRTSMDTGPSVRSVDSRYTRSAPRISSSTIQVPDEMIDLSYESLVQLEDVTCGLSREIIERLIPQVAVTSLMGTASCSICLSDLELGDSMAVVPSCLHRFHFSCIEQWLTRKKSCPICKEEII